MKFSSIVSLLARPVRFSRSCQNLSLDLSGLSPGVKVNGRRPDARAEDPNEKRLAAALLFLQKLKQQREAEKREPALTPGLRITALVSSLGNNPIVRAAVLDGLRARLPNLDIKVVEADDFHDRFWIADGERGLIVGASLNKIGGKIFFVDELSRSDVKAVLDEVDAIVGTCA